MWPKKNNYKGVMW